MYEVAFGSATTFSFCSLTSFLAGLEEDPFPFPTTCEPECLLFLFLGYDGTGVNSSSVVGWDKGSIATFEFELSLPFLPLK